MTAGDLSGGTVHAVPYDARTAIEADPAVIALWQSLTPLGRNEFLCWIEDAKQPATRVRRISRTLDELREGKRRPCCWSGCIHRADKAPGAWQQAVLIDKKPRKSG
jgi:Bacteriocin-protection, YdeI or OmpD-Associated